MSNPIFSFFGEVGLKTMEAEKGLQEITKKAKDTSDKVKTNLSGMAEGLKDIANEAKSAADKIKFNFSAISTGINNAISGMASGMSSAMSSIGKMASSIGSSLNKYITKPALIAGKALETLILKKGWDRINTIDEAAVKLKALGLTGEEVTQVYNNATDAVTGTAHGLDEAFNVASQAAASGVQAGQEMEAYLRRVADAASYAGISMDEMGSIFNKVLTGGVAQADEINQIAGRGVPIYTMLADVMGVTAGEIKQLASEGKITDEIFMEAFDNIEGYAKNSADTVKGAWSLVMSSIARIGMYLFGQFNEDTAEVEGGLASIKDALTAVRDILIPIEAIAKDVGTALNEALEGPAGKLKEFAEGWGELDKETQIAKIKSVAAYGAMVVGIGPLLMVFGKIATIGGKVTKAIGAIGKSLTKLGVTASQSTGALAHFSGIFSGLGTLVNFGAIALGAGAFGGVLAILGLVQQQFGDQLDAMFAMAQTKGPEIISGLAQGITSKLPELISLGTTLLTNFLDTISANLPALMEGGAEILGSLITGFSESIPDLMGSAIEFLFAAIKGLIKSLPGLISAGGDLIQGLVDGFVENWPLLKEEIENLGPVIREAVEDIIEDLKEKYEELKEKVQELIDKYQEWADEHPILASFIEGLALSIGILTAAFVVYKTAMWLATTATTIFTGAVTILTAVIGFLTSPITLTVLAITALITIVYMLWKNWDEIGPKLAEVWENIKTWISEKVEALVTAVVEGFSNMWKKVTTFVDNLVTDIKTGFTEAWNTVKEKVKGMYESVKEWFGKIPGKIKEQWGQAQSFLEGISLVQIGKDIFNGLWKGMKDVWSGIQGWISDKASELPGWIKKPLGIASPSKVMAKEVGRWIPIGLANGIEGAMGYVREAMGKMSNAVSGAPFSAPEVAMASNYTFKQQPTQAQQNNNNLLEEVIYLLRKLLQKDTDLIINGRVLSEEILDDINYLNDLYNNRDTRIRGGVAYP